MNNKELREIKRRLKPEKNNVGSIYGCYINGATREKIASFQEPMALLGQEEKEQYFALLSKCLSGGLGKDLAELSFTTQQVLEGKEHKLLSRLRDSRLEDEEAREELYALLAENLELDEKNYLILLAYEAYDVMHHKEDDSGGDVFRYLICAVCPVLPGKPELGYQHEQKRFHHEIIGQRVTKPVLGLMFPGFNDRSTDIYSALMYSHGMPQARQGFAQAILGQEPPMSPQEQRESFEELLDKATGSRCSFQLAQELGREMAQRVAAHKESGSAEVLTFSAGDMAEMLEDSGAEPEQAEAFAKGCQELLGDEAAMVSTNICQPKRMDIQTEQVKISLDPQHSHLVSTRSEGGRKYIVISAPGQVMINGLPVEIED